MQAELTGLEAVRIAILVYVSAMLPMIAARGAIILAAALQVPWYFAFLLSSAGAATVAALLLRIDHGSLEKLRKYKLLNSFFDLIDQRLAKHHDGIEKHAYRSLAMIVGLPFTGVGVCVACGIAIFLDLDYDKALLAVLFGALVYGFCTTAAVYGMLTGVRTLLEAAL